MESSTSEVADFQVKFGSTKSGIVVNGCKNIKSSGCLDVGWDVSGVSFRCWFGKKNDFLNFF